MKNAWCVVLVLLISTAGIAQVRPGPPIWDFPHRPGHGRAIGILPFESFGGGPFDSVNIGNLNVHLAIPVLNKSGRGMPFSYFLSYDSSIWVPETSNGTTSWTPITDTNWGWTSSMPRGGHVSNKISITNSYCTEPPHGIKYAIITTTYSNWAYYDGFGTPHPFSGTSSTQTSNVCNTGGTTGFTGTSTDNSGYTITVNGSSVSSLTAHDGTTINPTSGSTSATDANGNEITSSTTSGVTTYTDTLGTTALVLSGSGTASSPYYFTYPAPSSSSSTCNPITDCASYTMAFEEYTVATNFGVAGVAEYGPGTSGVPLVSSIQLPDGTQYQFTYEKTPGSSCSPLPNTYSSNCVTGRIASVTLPTGGEIQYTYSGGSNGIFSDGSAAGLTRLICPTPQTCSSGASWLYTRTLENGIPGPASSWQTTVTDPNGNNTVINFAEDANTTTPTYSLYETGRVINQLISGTQTPLLTTTTCYNGNYAYCATLGTTVTSPITQTDFYRQLPNGQTALSELQYNIYGLVTNDNEYDYGAVVGSAPGHTHEIRQTTILYYTPFNGVADMMQTVSVYDWTSGRIVASTTYTFDGVAVVATSGTPQHVSVSGGRGNLTTFATEANGSTTLYQQYTYYDTGMLNNSTSADASSSTTCASKPSICTTYNYSNVNATCGNAFATSLSEPMSLSRSMTWNCTGAVMLTLKDENGNTATIDYSTDAYFWRPDYTLDQLNNKTTLSYSSTTAESKLEFNNNNSVSDALVTVDGFGRPILSQRAQDTTFTEYDTNETDYNNVGLPWRSTMPFQAAPSAINLSAPGVTTSYDALGRPWAPSGSAAITDGGGGTVSYAYNNNDILQTVSGSGSTQSFQKQYEYDGLGRLTSVCEVTAGTTAWPGGTCGQSNSLTGYWTKYTYDALGDLLTVTQNTQATSNTQSRTYTYDMLSRLTSETNPETGNNSPGTSYTYDVACGGSYSASAGDLTKRVDNAGNTTCYAYDGLHRLTDAGNTGTCRHYRYDSQTPPSGVTVTNTLSRMAEAYTDNCSSSQITVEWYGYDADGRLTDVYEKTPHSNGYYHGSSAYWANGAMNTLSIYNSTPSLIFPTINYGGAGSSSDLDGEGRYTKVTASSGTSPMTSASYVTSGTSEPIGVITGVTVGSGDSDSFTYDPNTGRPKTYTFSVNGVNDKGTLTWNANGTLSKLAIADSLSGSTDSQTCNYLYDDLARSGLIPTLSGPPTNYAANCGTPWEQSFSYDPFGNISKQGGTSSFLPTYSAATNQISSFTYDNNGNVLTDNIPNTYTWDPNWGNPASVNSTNLIYDANGLMVEQQNGSAYTQILYSPAGKTAIMNGQTLAKAFVHLPGAVTAIYNSSSPAYYRHTDWLGTSRLTTTASRTVYSDSAYAPFGEQYALDGSADASFTGQNADTTTTLYDFPLREYSPTQGRWVSPDPAGMAAVDPTNPQSWNRYAYVVNAPLSGVDPLGLKLPVCSMLMIQEYACPWGYADVGMFNENGGGLGTPTGYFAPDFGFDGEFLGMDFIQTGFDLSYANGIGSANAANNGANPTLTFRLITKSDYCRGGDRTIQYWLVNTSTGAMPSSNWWVTEHIQASVPTNSGGTNNTPNQYLDWLSNGGAPYNALQTFTVSQGSGAPSYPVYVNIGGQDYGTLGLWMSNNPLRNGQPSPNSVNCPPQ